MAKKKSNVTKYVVIAVIAMVVLLVAVVVIGRVTGLFGTGERTVKVETDEVESRRITQVVTASGRAQPEVEVRISPDVSGEIIDLRVVEGQQVEKGDLLVRIKQDDYRAQVEQAQAGVLQAKATRAQRKADLLNAELDRDRQQGLFDASAVSESEIQQARTQYEVAVAAHEAAGYAVQSAEARLREARDMLRKTTIYSPMSGTVSKLDVELGERVVGTSQMSGTEMLRIARLDQMEMEVEVNENDVVNVTVGDSARIEIDAYPERGFKGFVTEIANSARVSGAGSQEQVTNFPVKIRIVDPHNQQVQAGQMGQVVTAEVPATESEVPYFRPGMSGTVDVYTMTIEDAIVVPIQAVTVRDINLLKREAKEKEERESRRRRRGQDEEAAPDTTNEDIEDLDEDLKRVVFTVDDGKARLVEVETGISDDTHIQIRSGLDGGAAAEDQS
jgi:HlyD family secretion protein